MNKENNIYTKDFTKQDEETYQIFKDNKVFNIGYHFGFKYGFNEGISLNNPGLKDHQIRELTNYLTKRFKDRFPEMPGFLREFVSRAVIDYIDNNDLRIDKGK